MSNLPYAGYEISITLATYGLFDGVQGSADLHELDMDATKEVWRSRTQEFLENEFPGAVLDVSYAFDYVTYNGVIRVFDGQGNRHENIENDIVELFETSEVFDFSDASNWVYTVQQ